MTHINKRVAARIAELQQRWEWATGDSVAYYTKHLDLDDWRSGLNEEDAQELTALIKLVQAT